MTLFVFIDEGKLVKKDKKEASVNNIITYSVSDINILSNKTSKMRLKNLFSIYNLADDFFCELNKKYGLCEEINKQFLVQINGYAIKIKCEQDLLNYICDINIVGSRTASLFVKKNN